MKRRTKRDLSVLAGVVAILGAIAFFNTTVSRLALAREMEALRSGLEKDRRAEGLDLLDWKLMRKTKGTATPQIVRDLLVSLLK